MGKIEPRTLTSRISETGCHKYHSRDVPPSWARHASNHKFHVVIKGVVINNKNVQHRENKKYACLNVYVLI